MSNRFGTNLAAANVKLICNYIHEFHALSKLHKNVFSCYSNLRVFLMTSSPHFTQNKSVVPHGGIGFFGVGAVHPIMAQRRRIAKRSTPLRRSARSLLAPGSIFSSVLEAFSQVQKTKMIKEQWVFHGTVSAPRRFSFPKSFFQFPEKKHLIIVVFQEFRIWPGGPSYANKLSVITLIKYVSCCFSTFHRFEFLTQV